MKRKLIGLVLIMFIYCNTVFAMESVDLEMVKDAQNFGVMNVSKTANELEMPWTFFNALNKQKKDNSEKIIIYTPYLVTALDAQNKTKSGALINEKYGLVLAENYKDILVVGAMLNSKIRLEPNDLKIKAKQDDKIIAPYYVIADTTKRNETFVDKKMSLSDAIKYKRKVEEKESLKKYKTREVEILSLSYQPLEKEKEPLKEETTLEETQKISADGTSGANDKSKFKTKSIVIKEDKNLFQEDLLKSRLEKNLNNEKEINNNNNMPVIFRVKNFNWRIDFLIYFDLNEIEVAKNVVLQIKDSSSNKRAFKFNLANIK